MHLATMSTSYVDVTTMAAEGYMGVLQPAWRGIRLYVNRAHLRRHVIELPFC